MKLTFNHKKGYVAAVAILLGLTGAIWRWLPGAVTMIASDTYLPHGFCYLWNKQLLTLHVASDSVIFLSYLAISASLAWLVYRVKRQIPLAWVLVSFGVFILACGFTHAMDVVVLWIPLYWLSGDIKLITAVSSLTTAIALPFLVPRILNILAAARNSSLNERRFKSATDASDDSFFILESVRDSAGEIVDFRFVFMNEKGAKLLCGTPESVQGELLCERYPVNRTHGFFEGYKRVVETGEPLHGEFPIDSPGINASWLHLHVHKSDDGVAITSRNISELRLTELKLAETNGRFKSLVEGVKDHALFTVDPTGRVDGWNRGAERLLGYSEADIVGKDFSCIFPPQDIQDGLPEKLLDQALRTGRADDEGWRILANGKLFWASVSKTALLTDSGDLRGFAIIVQDRTEQRKVALALEEILQERTKVREKFLSHVSHELRTPLTAIYFFTSNVLDGLIGDLTPEQHEHLTLALDNVNQLKDMVSDLLDITRTETHKLSVVPQHTGAARLAADVLGTCRRNAKLKNVHMRSEVAQSLPFLWADPSRVRQILTNLVENGIKFTPAGGTITIRNEPLADDDEFMCLSVSDTGCGIPQESLEVIFDRLAQVGVSDVDSRAGLGLGLFITKELVSRHGGRIWAESGPGRGSTFFFTLPVFRLGKMCAHIFNDSNLEGSVALIAVDVAAISGTLSPSILLEIRRVLELCVREGHDMLLPSMSDAEPEETFFIVCCTHRPDGLAAVAARINKKLQNFDSLGELMPLVSRKELVVVPDGSRERRINDIAAQIERLVQSHLQNREILQ